MSFEITSNRILIANSNNEKVFDTNSRMLHMFNMWGKNETFNMPAIKHNTAPFELEIPIIEFEQPSSFIFARLNNGVLVNSSYVLLSLITPSSSKPLVAMITLTFYIVYKTVYVKIKAFNYSGIDIPSLDIPKPVIFAGNYDL